VVTPIKSLARSTTIALVLFGSTLVCWAQASGGGVGDSGGELPGAMQVTGKVVCVGCTVSDVHRTQPQLPHLYLLKFVGNEQQKAVVSVETVSAPLRWNALFFPHEVLIRSTEDFVHKLVAEENLYKTVSVMGQLRNDGSIDVENVTFQE